MSEGDLEAFRQTIPMGRFARTEDMIGPTAYLLSDWGQYHTGDTLHINGGQYMP